MTVSGGLQHERIPRSIDGKYTSIDIVESTFVLYRVETKDMLSPLRISLKYEENEFGSARPRLLVMTSKTNPKPEEKNHDAKYDTPRQFTIHASDGRMFHKEYVYFKFEALS
jgi:hypothetical protein